MYDIVACTFLSYRLLTHPFTIVIITIVILVIIVTTSTVIFITFI